MKQKGFAPIIILVLVALAVAGYFGYKYLQPKTSTKIAPQSYEECLKSPGSLLQESFPATCVAKSGARFTQPLTPDQQQNLTPPTDTSNWKTFTNNDEGFLIKYPNSWDDPTETQLSTRISYSFDSESLNITTGFYYDQTLQRPRTYEEEVAAQEKSAVGKRSLVVGGATKTVYVNTIGASTTDETVIFKGKGQDIIWITMTFPPGTDAAIFDQILSTFKFLDNKNSTGASCQYNGKVYNDGSVVPSGDKCNSCSCDNGQIACTTMACP